AKGSTYSSYYIELVTPDGDKNEYTTAVSCQNYVNRVVKLTFSDGNAIVKTANTQNGVSGMVDAVGGTIGSCRVASNVNILDISSTNGGDIALYKNIYLKRIDGIKLNAEDIIYFTKNENGEINNIILKNITGDIYEYGLITKVDNRAKTYTFDINGNPYSTSGSYTGISAGAPAKFVFKGSSLDSMTSISAVKGAVTNITSTKVITASSAYTLSDNVVIYTRKALDTAFTILPKDELLNNIDSYNISAYYDKTDNSGGRVRVIIAVEK
ncbi:MAG: hypothetical protein Q8873_09115, partial [Bacillota bacterium]|nr:hypothetical protein [Bacillota bacterium]